MCFEVRKKIFKCSLSFSDPPDPDFSDSSIDVIIPAASRTFEVPRFFTINDDNIDEDEQSFAIVAEILDVSEDIRLHLELYLALEHVEPLKLESLTMIMSLLNLLIDFNF